MENAYILKNWRDLLNIVIRCLVTNIRLGSLKAPYLLTVLTGHRYVDHLTLNSKALGSSETSGTRRLSTPPQIPKTWIISTTAVRKSDVPLKHPHGTGDVSVRDTCLHSVLHDTGSKERLDKVCVLRHGLQHLQDSCSYLEDEAWLVA